MSIPFFSIGIPVYNAEKYLNGCIDSILSQSFTNFELILVDDGSTDNSLSICQSYAEKDSRVKVFHYENGGISVASNHILDECIGEYVFLMDNDDTMCENLLEKAYDDLLANNYPDVMRTNAYMVRPDGNVITIINPKPDRPMDSMSKDERTLYLQLDSKMPNALWEKFIKNTIIKNNNIKFNKRYAGAQDLDFTLKVCRNAETYHFSDVYSSNWFHPREGSVSTAYNINTLVNTVTFYHEIINDLASWNAPEELIEQVKTLYIDVVRHLTVRAFRMKKEDIVKFCKAVGKINKKEFKKMYAKGTGYDTIFNLYPIIGADKTILLFNSYLRLKGVIS